MKNNKLQKLMEENMSRKRFLMTLGIIFLSVIGVTGALKKLTDSEMPQVSLPKSSGFGSSPYGK